MSIVFDQVSFSYPDAAGKEINALNKISFTLEKGQITGIMGHTGCGKSTLLHLIAGLEKPSSGRMLHNGLDINEKTYDRSLLRRHTGIVFQCPEYQLFETTVEKDVAFALKHSTLTAPEKAESVRWAMELMDLNYERYRHQSPLELSGGEKRKAAIAGVLVFRPDILLFDEPTTGLDAAGCQSFLTLLSRLRSEGITVILVSHNADVMGEAADRLLIMNRGQIVMDGTTREVFAKEALLKEIGLGISRPGEIASLLRQKGIAAEGIVTYQELLSRLKEVLS